MRQKMENRQTIKLDFNFIQDYAPALTILSQKIVLRIPFPGYKPGINPSTSNPQELGVR